MLVREISLFAIATILAIHTTRGGSEGGGLLFFVVIVVVFVWVLQEQ